MLETNLALEKLSADVTTKPILIVESAGLAQLQINYMDMLTNPL